MLLFRAALLALLFAGPAFAQAPITLVVNFAAGGPTDITSRLLAPALTTTLGAQVVVKNTAGAAGTIGAHEVARARPDGLTLLVSPIGPMVIQPHYRANLPYRPADFAPVCQFSSTPVVMMTPEASGLRSLRDVLERAREAQGGFPYASTGPGSVPHISMVALARAAGIGMNHIPFRGSGEVMVAFQQGSVAVFSDQPAVVARLEAACGAVMREPGMIAAFARVQMPIEYRGAADFAVFMAAESDKFRRIIEQTGMRSAE